MITDGNGSYIRKDEFSGKYVPVRNASFADRFDQRCKAANILKNAIGKNIRNQYKVVDIEEDVAPIKPTIKEVNNKNLVAKTIANETHAESQKEKWVSGTEKLTEFVMDAENRKEELIGKLSEVDKEISDINHYIEFGKFNAYQGWLAFSMLQNRLRKRRKIKDELSIINQLGECKITSNMMIDIKNAIAELGNRKYTPRVLTQLFD